VNGVSLYSGSAIGELCFQNIFPDYRTIVYVEIEKYCRSIIRARIRDGVLGDAPIFDDIRTFNARYARLFTGKVDWLSAGFPCQPFSVAGNQLGEADERNLWPETRDAIRIIRPRYVLLENVPGLLAHRYIRRIFGDLAEDGYDCEWDIVGASDCGARHKRKRLWIVAYPRCGSTDKIQSKRFTRSSKETDASSSSQDVSNSRSIESRGVSNVGGKEVSPVRCNGKSYERWRAVEPLLG